MLFGSTRDFNIITGLNRELLSDVIEQEVLYYKISLENSVTNLYGESLEKVFFEPALLNCLILRNDQVITVDEFGPDLSRDISFAFLRPDLTLIDLVPEKGDVLLWHEDYYEVDRVRENQLFLGKDPQYNFTSYGDQFGSSVSLVCDTHLTKAEKVGIKKVI